MKYIGDIQFGLTISIAIAALIMLGSLARVRGKELLLGFIILAMLSYVGYYVPNLLLRNDVMTYETYRKFIEPAGVVYTIMGLTSWGLLLAFIAGLKSMQQAGDATADPRFCSESMTVTRALFSFEGRLCRSDYWLKGFLPLLPIGIFNNVLAYGVAEDWARALSMLIALLSLWPGLALIVKRLHDRDKSGWFALIMLIPIVGSIILVVGVWFMKGTDGPNRFGPDPLQPAPAVAAEIASV